MAHKYDCKLKQLIMKKLLFLTNVNILDCMQQFEQ